MGTGSSPEWPQIAEDSQLQFLHQNCPGSESSLRLSLQPSPPSPVGSGVTVSALQAGGKATSSPKPFVCSAVGHIGTMGCFRGPNTGAVTPHEGSEMGKMDLKQKRHDEGLLIHQLSTLMGPDTLPRTLPVERVQSLAPQTTAVVCVVSLSPHAQMGGQRPLQHIPWGDPQPAQAHSPLIVWQSQDPLTAWHRRG